jgi:thiamine biosynthesis lipoprotein
MTPLKPIPIAALVCTWLAFNASAPAEDVPYRQSRVVMGTAAEIQVYHADQRVAEQAIAAALDEMQRVERLLSNYRPDSELSRMNRDAPKAPFAASGELYDFVKRCRSYFDETLGTFDPTVGPVVRAWGFFTSRPARPSTEAAAAAKARSGFDKVRLDDASRSVAYAVDGVELDPGGIGKGYAVDRAADVLRHSGISSALVSAGGSTLYALGHPPNRQGWEVGVKDPAAPSRLLRLVMLRDNSLSTSGVAQKYVLADGHRYGHIIDPRTGEPGEAMCQVTLVAPTATDSDALTKAAFLLSRDAVVRLFAMRGGVHVLRIEGACSEGRLVWVTPWSQGVFREPNGR